MQPSPARAEPRREAVTVQDRHRKRRPLGCDPVKVDPVQPVQDRIGPQRCRVRPAAHRRQADLRQRPAHSRISPPDRFNQVIGIKPGCAKHAVQRLDRHLERLFQLAEDFVVAVGHQPQLQFQVLRLPDRRLGILGNPVALCGRIGQRIAQHPDRPRQLRGAQHGSRGLSRLHRPLQVAGLPAGKVALGHGAAQRPVDRLEPRLQFPPPVLGRQKFRLHGRNLRQRRAEPLLRRHRLGGAQISLAGQRIQPVLIDRLVPHRLGPEIPRADRIHQDDRRRHDRPAGDNRAAPQDQQLPSGCQPDEPRLRLRPQEKPLFRQAPLKRRMKPKHEVRLHHRKVPIVAAPARGLTARRDCCDTFRGVP